MERGYIMGIMGKHGMTENTPQNVLFGAGTYHKNLKFEGGEWTGAIIGATSGGGKLSFKGEFVDIEIDGVLVKTKGLALKQGGTAVMEVNFAEINADIIKATTLFAKGESDAQGYDMFIDKAAIEEGDYIENFGFVGKTANDKKDIIVIFENALCTSGMEIESKGKNQSVIKATMEAYAKNEGNLDTLPVKIYYPSAD